ncbi:flagellar hook-associated protein FlgK [Halalkalibacter alkaliphilus]|uniref:Flagellar hook-associated protein 1 n=1 Tax=Halalkalibacter alkaliphilus TaxID=2917993 RepID=A0A9X2A113_9BACI|nr:flagellar hook-associated protein FlgK [Halalkalibacter alkaliphilus]MCL7746740.1 flagellar hook-associated protein FlgK [Halalkalibacter alkaliphilus]
MQSTFHGLETARRAMMTQQYALHTTGHNIANANTEGYTRQRVNFTQTESFPAVGKNTPRVPGNLGTGVAAGSIQRVRNEFLDVQYRTENNKVGYWEARAKSLEKMEDILNEPSEQGLNHQIDMFWMALQDLSVDPEDTGARSVVRQRSVAVAETFNYLHDSLSTIRNDYKNEIEVTEKEVNALLNQLNNVNEQIRKAEPHGYVTNDLYDQQDNILDRLSRVMNIQVQREHSGGQANSAAEGAVTVYLVNDAGVRYTDEAGNPIKLVNGKPDQNEPTHLKLAINFNDDNYVDGFTFAAHDADLTDPNVQQAGVIDLAAMPRGEMKGLIEAYGYEVDGAVRGLYPDMLEELNVMATAFANELNAIHRTGYTLPTDMIDAVLGGDFFQFEEGNAAGTIQIAGAIQSNLNNIAASSVNINALSDEDKAIYENMINQTPKDTNYFNELGSFLANAAYKENVTRSFAGDGSNAKLLANAKDARLPFENGTGTIGSYYQGVIGDMAVNANEANRMVSTTDTLRDSIEFRRQSVSNVSLDEEMTMMIQYQHAYNAAARNITMVDEMLDRIINGMGIVGR